MVAPELEMSQNKRTTFRFLLNFFFVRRPLPIADYASLRLKLAGPGSSSRAEFSVAFKARVGADYNR